VRGDFPLLSRRRVVYLDSAATSQKPMQVLDAMQRFYQLKNANVHRGVYRLAEEADEELEGARNAVRRFIGAPAPASVIFTRGTTESINLVARGWAEHRLRAGDEILITELEHHSNLLPWQRVAARTGAVLRLAPVEPSGGLDVGALEGMVGPRTRLIAFSLVSNVLGTELPAERIVQAARKVGAAVLIDAAQAAPHQVIDVRALGCDFLAFSGHKMLGPTGIGVLWVSPDRLDEVEPLLLGGGMVREVFAGSATFLDPPWKFEAGTRKPSAFTPRSATSKRCGWTKCKLMPGGWPRTPRCACETFPESPCTRRAGIASPCSASTWTECTRTTRRRFSISAASACGPATTARNR
jgi:cysteine desulfurase/selenocysteine lyase